MFYYEDFVASHNKGNFCVDAVRYYKTTPEYVEALEGERYYGGHNTTIENFQKFLYTLRGQKIPDSISANYHIKTQFFKRIVTNLTQYILGNGIQLESKDKLGRSIDNNLVELITRALCSGKAYGYWNGESLETFSCVETKTRPGFCPIWDLYTGKLRAGIRFWTRRINNKELTYYTLFTEEGIIDFKYYDNTVSQLSELVPYKVKIKSTQADGVISKTACDFFTTLPIIPLYINDTHESELTPIRDAIDAYDLIKSGLANNIDDFSSIYWIIKNASGMDDPDIARLMQRLKTAHGAVCNGDVELQSFAQEVPYEARQSMLSLLKDDIYADSMCVNLEKISAGNKTATEIKLAYALQDQRAAQLEYYIIDFVEKLQCLLNIDHEVPKFSWQKVINETEITSSIMSTASVLPAEVIIKKLPFLSSDEIEEALQLLDKNDYEMFNLEEPAVQEEEQL